MFNSKNSSSGNGQSPNLPAINMVSEGTTIKGALSTDNDVRVAGTIDGEASSSGKFMLTSSGVVNGDIESKDADIAGKVDGELRVSERLILRKSAIVTGDLYTKVLLVEEGARFDGACKMSSDPQSEAKQSKLRSKSESASQNGKSNHGSSGGSGSAEDKRNPSLTSKS